MKKAIKHRGKDGREGEKRGAGRANVRAVGSKKGREWREGGMRDELRQQGTEERLGEKGTLTRKGGKMAGQGKCEGREGERSKQGAMIDGRKSGWDRR
eukprot:6198717-Pleurochrysis_carterae.AAC.3